MARQAPRLLGWSERAPPRCRLRIPRGGRAEDPGPALAEYWLALPDGEPAHHLDGPRDWPPGDRPSGRDPGVAGTCAAARRSRRGEAAPHLVVERAWGGAGTILGMLVLLGPLLAIRALHPAAVVARRGPRVSPRPGMVCPIGLRRRLCYSGAGILILALPVCLFSQWNAAARTPPPIASRPSSGSANLLWIVLDTLRADHMSLYGYGRQTTPQIETWAKQGITFDMASSAASWTLPSHVTMFTGLWPFEHERADRPSLQWACSDPGRASPCPGLSDRRHRGQRQDVQHRLWCGAWVRRLPRLPLQPGDEPESHDVQLGAGKGGDGAGPENVAANPRAGPVRLAASRASSRPKDTPGSIKSTRGVRARLSIRTGRSSSS